MLRLHADPTTFAILGAENIISYLRSSCSTNCGKRHLCETMAVNASARFFPTMEYSPSNATRYSVTHCRSLDATGRSCFTFDMPKRLIVDATCRKVFVKEYFRSERGFPLICHKRSATSCPLKIAHHSRQVKFLGENCSCESAGHFVLRVLPC